MKTLLFFLLAAGALLPARAQTLTADWAVQCATNGQPYSLVVDAQGNSYVAGTFGGTITLGTTTLTATQAYGSNTGPRDVFLAKLNPQGQYLWAMQFGDGQSGGAYVGAVDNADNLYVSGTFRSYSYRLGANGPILYNSSNAAEGFVARFSAQTGQCQWARRFGGTGDDYAGVTVLNAAGEVYLTGTTGYGDADFGPYTLPSTSTSYSYSRPFLAKLSGSGSWLWARQLSSYPSGLSYQTYVARPLLDGLGNLYLTGSFGGTFTLGATTLTAAANGTVGTDLFIAKYTEEGRLRWARQANPGGSNGCSGGAAFYDGQGHLYLAGSFESQTARVGPFTLTNAGPLVPDPQPLPPYPNTTRYYSDGFIARYDTAGTWQWATRRGNYNTADAMGTPVSDGAGRLFALYGSDYGIPYRLVPLNPSTGALGSEFSLPFSTSLTNDQLGRLYLYGYFTEASLSLGGQTIPGAGGNTATGFVARLGALPLATQSPATSTSPALHAWPTPGPGTGVWVQGAPAGQAVEMFDMLGRRVGSGTMPATGPLRLNWPGAGLAAGVYVLRSGTQSCRWVVES